MFAPSSFGTWVQHQRKSLDLTQAELAERVGCATITIKKIEQEQRRPSRQLANLLAQHLQIAEADSERFVAMARGTIITRTPLPADQSTTVSGYQIFVGRERQLALLDDELAKGVNGQFRLRFITGEAGRGKSALLQAFARRAQHRYPNLIVAGGNCHAFAGVGDPYLPFRDVFAMLTGTENARWATAVDLQQYEQIDQLLPDFAQIITRRTPDLLGPLIPIGTLRQKIETLPPKQRARLRQFYQFAEQRQADTPSLAQRQLLDQACQFLLFFTQYHPLLLLLDDLQWMDNASLDLCFYLAQHMSHRMQHGGLLMIGAFRASEVALTQHGGVDASEKPHPLWAVTTELKRQLGEIEIDLEQTSSVENRALVEELLDSESNHLNNEFRNQLFQQTRGYPLFTVELLRMMQDRGMLTRDDAGAWTQNQPLNWDELPTRVEAAIAQRVGRLSSQLHHILQVAAVEGELFTAEVVARVVACDNHKVIYQLSSALSRQALLVESQGVHYVAEQRLSRYQFRHALFQTYLYQQLEPVERATLHEAIGRALEEVYQANCAKIAPQLARHFEEAGVMDKACHYLWLAGKRAINLSAYAEAANHLSKGRTLLHQVPPSRKRDQLEAEMLLPLGIALTATKHIVEPDVIETYHRVQVLTRRLGRPVNAPSLRALAISHLMRGELEQTDALGTQLLALAQQRNDLLLTSEAHYVLGVAHFWLGKLLSSRDHLAQAIACYAPQQAIRHVSTFGWNPKAVCLCRLAYTLWYLGYSEQAVATAQKARRFAEDLEHPFSLAYVLCFSTWLYHDCCKIEKARETVEAALALLTQYPFPHWQLMAEILQGRLMAMAGETKRGLRQMKRAISECQRFDLQSGLTYYYGLMAHIYDEMRCGEPGLAAVQTGLTIARKYGDRHYEAELYRLQGSLLLHTSQKYTRSAKAEDCFQRAIQVARQQSAKSLELRATMSLCRLWVRQGKIDIAQHRLRTMYARFTEGFDTPELQAAQMLLRDIGSDD